jgi:hypothetical protein
MVFFNAILMVFNSFKMYKEFKNDGANPFIRSLLGAFF